MSSKNKKQKVFVAMSGGVDSSVAAALLKEKGYDVTGVHMVCWDGCENSQDRRDAMRVAAVLDIPFETWDFREEYKKEVYDYMIREYSEGRTPNPDVMCNKQIKFGVFLKKALEIGVDFIATGHYVRKFEKECDNSSLQPPPLTVRGGGEEGDINLSLGGGVTLFQAKDLKKDQSYFLWALTQDQLKHCLFPIGEYLKSEVRELAKKFNLPTSQKKDSQGLCFVGKVDFMDFLSEKLPQKAGAILNSDGQKIGEHKGAHLFTVGQRHGLNLGGRENPVYVAKKNIASNTIVVAEEKSEILYKNEVKVHSVNWISMLDSNQVLARIRYRQPLQKAEIFGDRVVFDVPQRAVSSGQSVVFYSKSGEVLGGGIIA